MKKVTIYKTLNGYLVICGNIEGYTLEAVIQNASYSFDSMEAMLEKFPDIIPQSNIHKKKS